MHKDSGFTKGQGKATNTVKSPGAPKVKAVGTAPGGAHPLHTMDKQFAQSAQSISALRPDGAGERSGKYGHAGIQ